MKTEGVGSEAIKVTVDQISSAREMRAAAIREMLALPDISSVLLLTLNIPGPVKDLPLYRQIHRAGVSEIEKSLRWCKIQFMKKGSFYLPAGPECLFGIAAGQAGSPGPSPAEIKKITAAIEENHPLGRFMDIDVHDKSGVKVSSGRGMRKCFICGNGAFACSRSEAHPLEALISEIRRKSFDYFSDYCAWKTAELACRALLYEAAATPKPGLVDRENCGAHSDMDFFSFINSSTSLFRTFYRISETSYAFSQACGKPEDLLAKLKGIGIEGEKDMFEATGWVNTQKGLIYSAGLLAASFSYIYAKHGGSVSAEEICFTAGVIASGDARSRLASLRDASLSAGPTAGPETYGGKNYLRYGLEGALGEAAGGFRTALYGFKVLARSLSSGHDLNLSLADTLMRIMEKAQDTNLPGRKDIEALDYMHREAENYNTGGGVFSDPGFEKLREIDRAFIRKNLSPGGCADLLALSAFLYFLTAEPGLY